LSAQKRLILNINSHYSILDKGFEKVNTLFTKNKKRNIIFLHYVIGNIPYLFLQFHNYQKLLPFSF